MGHHLTYERFAEMGGTHSSTTTPEIIVNNDVQGQGPSTINQAAEVQHYGTMAIMAILFVIGVAVTLLTIKCLKKRCQKFRQRRRERRQHRRAQRPILPMHAMHVPPPAPAPMSPMPPPPPEVVIHPQERSVRYANIRVPQPGINYPAPPRNSPVGLTVTTPNNLVGSQPIAIPSQPKSFSFSPEFWESAKNFYLANPHIPPHPTFLAKFPLWPSPPEITPTNVSGVSMEPQVGSAEASDAVTTSAPTQQDQAWASLLATST